MNNVTMNIYQAYSVYQVTAVLVAPNLIKKISQINISLAHLVENKKRELVSLGLIVPLDTPNSQWDWERVSSTAQRANNLSAWSANVQKISEIEISIKDLAYRHSIMTQGFVGPLLLNRLLESDIKCVKEEIEKVLTCCTKNLDMYQSMLQGEIRS